MAIVAAGFRLTLQLMDGTGKITDHTVRLRAADAEEAATAATAYRTKFMATTDDLLVGYGITELFTENAMGSLPAPTVLNSVRAQISAAILDQPFKFASLTIPGPKIEIFVGTSGKNSTIVDVNDTLVTQLLTEYTEAGSAYISDGESLDPVFNASGERVTYYRRLGKRS